MSTFAERIASYTRYTLEQGIPIPENAHIQDAPPRPGTINPPTLKYPFYNMQVGDSFWVPLPTKKTLIQQIYRASAKYGHWYACSHDRIWRIA